MWVKFSFGSKPAKEMFIIIIRFETVHFFPAWLGLDVCPLWSHSTYPWILPILAAECHYSHSPQVFLPLLYIPVTPTLLQADTVTPNHLHSRSLQMLKPSQSAMPRHIGHTMNSQNMVRIKHDQNNRDWRLFKNSSGMLITKDKWK